MALQNTDKILAEIREERQRQEELWGTQRHKPEIWYTILGEEFGEVGRALCELQFSDHPSIAMTNYREELIHVAAVAAAMVECLDAESEKIKRIANGEH